MFCLFKYLSDHDRFQLALAAVLAVSMIATSVRHKEKKAPGFTPGENYLQPSKLRISRPTRAAKLASVDGLYSDLLLHDMGQELGDSGSYGIPFSDGQDSDVVSVQLANATPVSPFATAQQTSEQTATLKGALRQGSEKKRGIRGRSRTIAQATVRLFNEPFLEFSPLPLVRGSDNVAMPSKGNFYPNGRFLGPDLGKLT